MIPLSLPERLVAWFLRTFVRSVLGPPFPVRAQRLWLDVVSGLNLPPRGVTRQRTTIGGVPAVTFAPRGVPGDGAPHRPVVLYLHGGAFLVGSARSHQQLTGYLALATGGPVHSLEYRLAPEHPWPAGAEDALAGYRALVAAGVPASRIVVAGDSAGGAMALDLALALRDAGDPPPAGVVLFSAAVGLGRERPAGAGPKDTLVRPAWAEQSARLYGRPEAQRILGGDLTGLPPLHVQYSDEEHLAEDSRILVRELRAVGAEPEVRAWTGPFHELALLPGVLKRARRAIGDAAAFAVRVAAEEPGGALRRPPESRAS